MKNIIGREWKQFAAVALGMSVVYLLFRNARAAEDMAEMMREALQ